ncbi:DUF1275 family protein [Streptomyces sp. NPDC059460]|uniref:DUF1275 family protein n=1 Tax=Streptomyces sp. NPDC059460 TaxID=3346840 RepID=UPI00367F2EA7
MLLVVASGEVEAVSLLSLNHVFAGVMTSNLALLGIAAGRGEPFDVTAACLALVGFGAGTAIVAWYTRGSVTSATHWLRRVVLVLSADALLMAVGAPLRALTGGRPGEGLRDVLQCG